MSTATLDIPAILEQARSGDTGAFAQIVRQYQSLVSGVLYNATGDFHKSEDIAQETFLIAWQKLGELWTGRSAIVILQRSDACITG